MKRLFLIVALIIPASMVAMDGKSDGRESSEIHSIDDDNLLFERLNAAYSAMNYFSLYKNPLLYNPDAADLNNASSMEPLEVVKSKCDKYAEQLLTNKEEELVTQIEVAAARKMVTFLSHYNNTNQETLNRLRQFVLKNSTFTVPTLNQVR